MPSKKKKYNARFPAGRIKKIMQSDEEVGKVAQAVPVIISRTLELFVESLLTKTLKITNSRNAKTLSPSHMKQCIMAENRFDFLRELVKSIPDISVSEELGHEGSAPGTPQIESPPQREPYDLSKPSTSCEINFNTNGDDTGTNGSNTSCSKLNSSSGSSFLPNSREDLMKQWGNVNQIRQEIFTSTSTTTTTTPTTTTALCNNSNKSRKRSISSAHLRPLKMKPSLDSTSNTSSQPIVTLNMNEKPIINLDFSQTNLHITKPNTSTTSNKHKDDLEINIDLTEIATQPPTIHFNLGKNNSCSSSSNSGSSSNAKSKSNTKTQNEINSSTVRTSSLDLDEDYDNI